jgi:glycosyltransferase involved in cell wall biosynthesis
MGLHLKSVFPNVPWVADFRDEWTNNPYLLDKPHNQLRMNLEKSMEKKVLINADHLITNTPMMLNNFLNNNPDITSLKDKFCFIPNGYDKDDFKDLSTAVPENEKFTMTYTGLLYGQRKPDTLFEAVKRLISEKVIDSQKVRIKLIGNYKAGYMNELVESFGLKAVVEIYPYMKHNECIKHLVTSDALLHIEGNGRGSEAFYSGKIFEYMNTGRPVLAIIPGKGVAAQLIHDTEIGLVSDSDDILQTMENIKMLYSNWINRVDNFSPDKDKIAGYEREALTAKLADVFNQIIK